MAQPQITEKPIVESPNPNKLGRWKMTFDQFLEWDGDGNADRRVEWIDGEAVELVSVTIQHAKMVTFLQMLIGGICAARGIGTLVSEPFIMRAAVDGNGRSPDVILIRKENEARLEGRFLSGPADLVIEVVSPGSAKTDFIVKLAEYYRAGIPEYWIIDPIGKNVTFFVIGSDRQYTEASFNESGNFESPSLNSIEFNPAWFTADELPNPLQILKDWGLV